jgi:enoyl-CoA hydratase
MVRTENRGGHRAVIIDRPEKRNALTLDMVRDLRDALLDAESAPGVRAVLVSAEGPSFSAGVDLQEFARGTPESAHTLIDTLRDLCGTARNLPKPIACAVRGHCLGGALEFALACDFRVCTADASFGMPEVAVGIPSVIDAVLFQHYIGLGRAREMLLTGEPVGAAAALEWGMVNRIVDGDRLEATAVELLGSVTRHAPAAIRAQKELIEDWLNQPLQESIDTSMTFLVDSFRDGTPQRIAGDLLGRRKKSG